MRIAVGGIAVLAPGLDGWAASRDVLAGRAAYAEAPLALPPPPSLPPAERRRTTATIRLAMAVAEAALAASVPVDVRRLASVFASANGDGAVIATILEALAATPRVVSPTQFHNSVHNSPPAYWAIGAGGMGASTSLGCWDVSFAAGLLQAAAKVTVRREPVLLCGYDMPFPEPLASVRFTTFPFAVAMLLTPARNEHTEAELAVRFVAEPLPAEEALPRLPALRQLHAANPAARSLRLLEALARRDTDLVRLAHLDGAHVAIEVGPC